MLLVKGVFEIYFEFSIILFFLMKLKMVCPIGFEPMAYGLEIRCSILLSYGHIINDIVIIIINEYNSFYNNLKKIAKKI